MRKPMTKMLIYVGIFFVIIFGVYGVKKALFYYFVSHYQPPAVTISATEAIAETWQSYITAVSTLTAINGVEVSAEVPGIVQEIRFTSGQFVKQGAVLIALRTDVEQASLKSNEAKLQLAKINYERDQTLFAKKVSSQATLDTKYAELLQTQAGVDAANAQIKQKIIRAPFDGKLGIRQVNLGQYISPGASMVTLQSLNPLYVMFNLPEQHLANLYQGQDIDVTVNFGSGKTIRGHIIALNSKIEQTTRNILVQGSIPNENFELYPGMYGLTKIWLKKKTPLIVVPQTAISYSLSGDYVYLVKEENKTKHEKELHVYRQYVKVGERRGEFASIVTGLKAGDRIVTSGQLKLQNGARVVIDNSIQL